MEMKKTLFLDIDGCLIKHHGNLTTQILFDVEILDGTIKKLNEWESEGHKIVLITGRKESMRTITEKQLLSVGIFYDQLIMGIARGERVIINDDKPSSPSMITAKAIMIKRNEGIKNIKL